MMSFFSYPPRKEYYILPEIHAEARKKDTKRLKVLLEINPSDIHALDDFGRTPAYYAIDVGSAENLKLFIEAGVKVDMELLNDIVLRGNLECFKVVLNFEIVFHNDLIDRMVVSEMSEQLCELYRHGNYYRKGKYVGNYYFREMNKLVDRLDNRRLILFLMKKIKKLPNELFRELSYFF